MFIHLDKVTYTEHWEIENRVKFLLSSPVKAPLDKLGRI